MGHACLEEVHLPGVSEVVPWYSCRYKSTRHPARKGWDLVEGRMEIVEDMRSSGCMFERNTSGGFLYVLDQGHGGRGKLDGEDSWGDEDELSIKDRTRNYNVWTGMVIF